jgi:hypothetical protein
MNNLSIERASERGSAGVKFLITALVLVIIGNAGANYIPIAYEGASFRQEMDTAVVKGISATGNVKPLDVVTASVRRAAVDHNVPAEAFVEIKPVNGVVNAHVVYSKQVGILPFGIYDYTYHFDHRATPTGYLLKQ